MKNVIKIIISNFKTIFLIISICNIFLKEYLYYLWHQNYYKVMYNIISKIANVNILYIKLFQAFALNNQFIDETVNNILVSYTDNVPYTSEDIDYETIRQAMNLYQLSFYENNVNNTYPLQKELIPINSGMISLVFKMYKKTATESNIPVVLKIKRKNIDNKLNESLEELQNFIKFISIVPLLNKIKLNTIFEKNKDILKQQLNFEIELNNIRQFQKLSRNIDYIAIPNLYPEITQKFNNIIVMEFVEGKKLDQIINDTNNKEYFSKCIIKILFLSVLSGIIHGDLHSGNILFLDNTKKICLLDFGIVLKVNEITHQSLLCVIQNMYIKRPEELSVELLKIIINNYDILSSTTELTNHHTTLLHIVSDIVIEIQEKSQKYDIFKYFSCMKEVMGYIEKHKLYNYDIILNDEFYKLNVVFMMASSIINNLCNTELLLLVNDVCKEMFHTDIF